MCFLRVGSMDAFGSGAAKMRRWVVWLAILVFFFSVFGGGWINQRKWRWRWRRLCCVDMFLECGQWSVVSGGVHWIGTCVVRSGSVFFVVTCAVGGGQGRLVMF